MKKIINWFRDLFYILTDYALIICVILIVGTVLIWRLNILFSLKPDKQAIADNIPPISIENNTDENIPDPNNSSNESNKSDDNSQDVTQDNSSNSQGTENNNEDDNENVNPVVSPGQNVEINIPYGSFPGRIADILIEKGLISDKSKFLTRSTELGLDTRLKAGDFTIVAGTDIDTILEILSK